MEVPKLPCRSGDAKNLQEHSAVDQITKHIEQMCSRHDVNTVEVERLGTHGKSALWFSEQNVCNFENLACGFLAGTKGLRLPRWSSVLPSDGTRRFGLNGALDFVKNVAGKIMNSDCMVCLRVVFKTVSWLQDSQRSARLNV